MVLRRVKGLRVDNVVVLLAVHRVVALIAAAGHQRSVRQVDHRKVLLLRR